MSQRELPAPIRWRDKYSRPTDYSRDQLIATYFANDRAAGGNQTLFWAWEVVNDAIQDGVVNDAWSLVLDLVAAAPDPLTLGLIGAGALEDLLWRAGDELIDRVEREAAHNPRLREAIGSVWIGTDHATQQTVDRLYALAGRDLGNWSVDDSGIPISALQLLASERIEDRRWGARQLLTAPDSPAQRKIFVELLHSGDEDLRETASRALAYSRDHSLLNELVRELDQHPGVRGGRGLAWSVNWLAHYADEDGRRSAREALVAFAARGDEATKRHVEELLNPDLAKSRLLNVGQRIVELSEAMLKAREAEDQDVSELREQLAKFQLTVNRIEEDRRG